MQTGMICNCKQVSYADVENALHQMTSFSDVLEAFDEVHERLPIASYRLRWLSR